MKCETTNIDTLPLSLTVEDVAKALGVGKANAYALCRTKGFPCVQVGNRLVIPKPAFTKWLENPTGGNQ